MPAAGSIKTEIQIGSDTYNVEVNIPSASTEPYIFKVADDNVNLIGFAVSPGVSISSSNVYLTISPPPSILPSMIKSLSVNFFNGTYTSASNPLLGTGGSQNTIGNSGIVPPQ